MKLWVWSGLKAHNIKITKGIKTNYLVDDIVFEDWSYSAKTWMENLKEKNNEKENNKTNMISFQYYGKRFLISGDAENQLGNEILKTANYIKVVDFYQVSHHGSDNALGNNFISKIKLKYCYIPGTSFKSDSDPWFKFVASKTHTFPKEPTIQDLKKFTTNIRMTGEKPTASWSSVIKVEQKTLIFAVNNMGMINDSTLSKTVIIS